MARLSRRQLVVFAGGAGLLVAARFGEHRIARSWPSTAPLSPDAQKLIDDAWKGLDPAKVLDTHVHLVGTGDSGSGCYVGPRMTTLSRPSDYFKFSVYREASGVEDAARTDAEYLARLTELLGTPKPHGRALLFAFDQFHDDDGNPVREESEFYTPNDYPLSLAKKRPDLFVACASIHPYRKDAISELERCAEQGAVAVKWLPNAMNIDPSSPRCDAFYQALARLKIPLISHAGEEKAVHAENRQRLGNPLHLRRALEQGATVVIAHCASLGQNPDLDQPAGSDGGQPWVDNLELFFRLMKDPKWEGRLFGDVSALTIITRIGEPLRRVLRDAPLQRRLINGSDYPLPAINVVMQTRAVEKEGFITADQRALINEIERHNPLLMDFVLKRTVRWTENGQSLRLADDVFTGRPEVFPRLA